jgi:hypothetical protein
MEKLAQLKEKHYALEERIAEIGKKHFPTSVTLSQELAELIEEIETTQEREKIPSNQVLSAKIKIVKYSIKLAKRLKYFEEAVVIEFDRGNITKEFGRGLISVTKRIKDNKMPLAKSQFEQFQEIIELSKEYEESKEKLDTESKALTKEQYRIKQLIKELSWLEAQSVDLEKARKHEELMEKMAELEKLRASYLKSLTSEPISTLLEDASSLKEHIPVFPADAEMAELRDFFSAYPAIGKYKVGQICELLTFSEKKLSHVCPETSKFKKVVLGNKKLFDSLHNIEQSGFLAVDGGNEKILEFYSGRVEGAQPFIEQIRLLQKENPSCKSEYEKKNKLEKKRKELSKYSKECLEADLEEANSKLEFLHSEPGQEPVQAETKKENKGEKQGFLSKISSFFKT